MVALVLAACVGACGGVPPQATALDAERAHVALGELQRGRQLLVAKCGSSCHAAPLPGDHTAGEWPAKLDEMSARANVDREQRHLIELYLIALAKP